MATSIIARTEADLVPPPIAEALLFDWDGTLFDNHHFNFAVMRDALAAHGVGITGDWFEANAGYSARHMVTRAAQEQRRDLDPLHVLALRDEIAADRVDQVQPIQAVHDLVRSCLPTHRLAVVTGSERSNIDSTLKRFGMQDTFDPIVSRDQISRGKPDPEGYLTALRLLGLPPERAVVYEDSDQGVAAGLAAGIDVIDVRGLTASL